MGEMADFYTERMMDEEAEFHFEQQEILKHPPKCPYCRSNAELVDAEELFPQNKELRGRSFWECKACAAWVVCYPDTILPFGTLANKNLRRLRIEAHSAFDAMLAAKHFTRSAGYAWLSKKMRIPPEACHIRFFDERRAKKAKDICLLETLG